ncbi:MAG: DUF2911 domain-containing protein [Bacteroidota bacterium]|nr:DUF2911 domain-containing protein [Candidatus Kapabacteria bacterium]MDW8220588.1 DUF2911 domain-containing protein [Bacteroidota bacterium]
MFETILTVGAIVCGLVVAAVLVVILLMWAKVDISGIFRVLASWQNSATRTSPHESVAGKVGTTTLHIRYGRPRKRGRHIFGKLVPYNTVWRTGANEATEISTDTDVIVGEKLLKAGTYQLFTIPRPEAWTIIFNSKRGQWGAFFYNPHYDILRIDIPVRSLDGTSPVEQLTITIDSLAPNTGFTIMWDTVAVHVPVKSP